MTELDEITALVQSCKIDLGRAETGDDGARVQARMKLQQIRKLAVDLRKKLQELKKTTYIRTT